MAGSRRTVTSVEFWEMRRPLDFHGSRGRMCKVTHARVGGRIACGIDERSWPQPQDVPWPNPVLGRAWRCPNCVRAIRIGRLGNRSARGHSSGGTRAGAERYR